MYCTVMYCTVVYCTLLDCTVLYCTVLLPPGGNPIAVNKYININVITLFDSIEILLRQERCIYEINNFVIILWLFICIRTAVVV